MQNVQFRVLGPLEVEHDGQLLGIGGPKERAVLALLLLHANERVSYELLSEGLWDQTPPESARHTLSVYVSRLRKSFRSAGVEATIEARPGGYLLRLDSEQLDLSCFERLLSTGRAALAENSPALAAARLDEALSLWHGEPMAGLADEPFAPIEIGRLEELRLSAIEARMDAALVLGREADVIGELSALVSLYGLREGFRAQLMAALYRTGRQAEALEVYREGRQLLVEELGVEPGERLQELQRAILRHELPAPEPERPPVPETLPAATRARITPRRLTMIGVPVAVVVAGLVLAVVLVLPQTGTATLANGLATVDPRSGSVRQLLSIPGRPGAVAATRDSLWVTQPGDRTLLRVDPRTRRIDGIVKLGSEPDGIVAAGGSVWVALPAAGSVYRIDPRTGAVTRIVRVGSAPTALAACCGSIWVMDRHDRTVSRLNARSGRIAAVIRTGAATGDIAGGGGSVWVADESAAQVIRIDPVSNAVVRGITVGNGPSAVAAGNAAVWVANRLDATVSRIDPRTGRVTATIRVGESPSALLLRNGSVWVASDLNDALTEIRSPSEPPRTVALGGQPVGMTSAGDPLVLSVARADAR